MSKQHAKDSPASEENETDQMDEAFAALLQTLQPSAEAAHQRLAANLSHRFSQGHACLDLRDQDAHWLASAKTMPWTQGENSPLVLQDDRLYLRRSWRAEQVILSSLRQRLAFDHAVPDDLASLLRRLFSEGQAPRSGAPDWQQVACALACRSGVTLITGGPGTGKTTTVVRLLALLQSQALARGQALRMALAAPTGKAAARLAESVFAALGQLPPGLQAQLPVQASTLHRLLGLRGASLTRSPSPLALDVLVVDEASMIDLELMACLMQAVPARARLILLGDKDQLASVESGAVMAQLCHGAAAAPYTAASRQWLLQTAGIDLSNWVATASSVAPDRPSALAQQTVMLRESRRFGPDSEIGQWAQAVNEGDLERLRTLWQSMPLATQASQASVARIDLAQARGQTFDELLRQAWQPLMAVIESLDAKGCDDRQARSLLDGLARFQVLCATRTGPWGVQRINQRMALALGFGSQAWYPGRVVMMNHNDYQLQLMNGDTGLCLPHAQGLRLAFADGTDRVRWLSPSRLEQVDDAFAITVHKSQGSQFEHVMLVLPDQPLPVLTRELMYTAITRASQSLTWVGGDFSVLAHAIAHPVQRSGGLQAIHADPAPGV